MAIIERGLRKARSSVNVADLHPEFVARLRGYAADVRAQHGIEIEIYSAVRTKDHQTRLYRAYIGRGKRHPKVANPNWVNSRGRHGSAHMAQPASYKHGNLEPIGGVGYAVDHRPVGRPWTNAERDRIVDPLARKWGLVRSVPSENWHLVPTYDYAQSIGYLGRNSRGPKVGELQTALGITSDQHYGPATARAVTAWQAANGQPQTGEWSIADQDKLERLTRKAEPKVDRSPIAGSDEARRQRAEAAKEDRIERRAMRQALADLDDAEQLLAATRDHLQQGLKDGR